MWNKWLKLGVQQITSEEEEGIAADEKKEGYQHPPDVRYPPTFKLWLRLCRPDTTIEFVAM